MDYENNANPFEDVRHRIKKWKKLAIVDCDRSDNIAQKASQLMMLGLRQKDAAHVSCAIYLGADFFVTTDKKILNKPFAGIPAVNPIDFIRRYFDAQ